MGEKSLDDTNEKLQPHIDKLKDRIADVVAIIGIVTGLFFPSYLDLREKILTKSIQLEQNPFPIDSYALAHELLITSEYFLFTSFFLSMIGLLLPFLKKHYHYVMVWRFLFLTSPVLLFFAGCFCFTTVIMLFEEAGIISVAIFSALSAILAISGVILFLAVKRRAKKNKGKLIEKELKWTF